MDSTERKRKWDEPAVEEKRVDPAAAAAQAVAIAAKIAASLRPDSMALTRTGDAKHDGEFTQDIEINDLRNRYMLTKGSTQQQIAQETGCSIVTKGIWVPDKSKSMGEPPLYLHISAPSKSILDAAINKVNDLINQELGPLVEDRSQFGRRPGGPPTRQKWPEAKLPINLESLRNFNVRAKTVGPGGMFVKFIQAETGARVQIKGIGSGFLETETGREAEEPMHINIAGPDEGMIDRARVLAEDLLLVVRNEWEKARVAGQSFGNYAPQQQQQSQSYGAAAAGGDAYASYYAQYAQAGATPAAGAATPAATGDAATDAYAQYAAYWAQLGYDVNDPAFQEWQKTQMAAADPAAAGAQPAAPSS